MHTPRHRPVIARIAVLAALTVPALTACEGVEWVEGICMDDEVSVHYSETGGGYCRARKDSDPDCPDGQIPRETRPGREIDCVPNDISKEPAGEGRLTPKTAT